MLNKHFIEKREKITENLNLKSGTNVLEFKAKEKCIRPVDVGENEDTRCINLAIENINLGDEDADKTRD